MDQSKKTKRPKRKGEGKPLIFKTVKELQDAIDDYFSYCDNRIRTIYNEKTGDDIQIINPAPYTMSGLANRLGISRQCLSEYSHRELYGDAIMRARNKVQEDIETRLMETRNEKGAIFNLTNNFGWKVKNETDLTSKGEKIEGNTIMFADFHEADSQ